MRKVYNFNAGPSMLPDAVLEKAQKEMLDWHGTGMSIMEMGHRGMNFKVVAEQAEADLRELMNIPNNYKVLFLSGGATAQFAMIPMNLMSERKRADYVVTGIWSKKAMEEAMRFGDIELAAHLTQRQHKVALMNQADWAIRENIDYLHYTPNETIDGVEFQWVPNIGSVPLVADMSSMILSRPIDVSQFGLIYAGAQKNMGQAGITLVIVREDLIRKNPVFLTPTLYQYHVHAENSSFYNTPPTYSWYIMGLMLAWMKQQGGVPHFYKVNQRKAKKLYDVIDNSHGYYDCRVHPDCRSLMNVVFDLGDEHLDQQFLTEAEQAGLMNLKGHRLVGGVRASIYNAMPESGVDSLIAFMLAFAEKNPKK